MTKSSIKIGWILILITLFTCFSIILYQRNKSEVKANASLSQKTITESDTLQEQISNKMITENDQIVPKSYEEYLSNLKKNNEKIEANISSAFMIENSIKAYQGGLLFWNKELDKIYSILLAKQSASNKEKFKQEQLSWLIKRDKTVQNDQTGTVMYYVTLYNITKQRTLELIQRYYGAEFNEYDQKSYPIKQGNESYTVTIFQNYDYNGNALLQLFDATSHKLQSINLGWVFNELNFQDVNVDGYKDIVVITGGTSNESHDLYTWDASTSNFNKVLYKGFNVLAYFEVHKGYIMNWVKDTASSGVIQTLVWSGNNLVLKSEEHYKLDN